MFGFVGCAAAVALGFCYGDDVQGFPELDSVAGEFANFTPTDDLAAIGEECAPSIRVAHTARERGLVRIFHPGSDWELVRHD